MMAMAALAACGGSDNPSGPTRTDLGTQSGTVVPQTANFHNVFANASGTFDVTVNWGNAANDLDVFVTSSNCSPATLGALERQEGSCTHLASARSTTTKPERVTWSGSANVTYRVWIANFGQTTDSYTVAAGITT
jgi:hypothetical protein